MSIAIVEDEADLREAVVEYLASRNLPAVAAGNGAEFRLLAARQPIDVAILDIDMPGEDGLSLARWLRREKPETGIIFATAAGSQIDRIVGLEIGADDYLTKPYELRELLARIKTVQRRLAPGRRGIAQPVRAPAVLPSDGNDLISAGSLTLHAGANRVTGPADKPVRLTASESELLRALATRPNRVLSRSQITELVGSEPGEGGREIDIRITRLRHKLREAGVPDGVIQTVRGEGYVFVPDRP